MPDQTTIAAKELNSQQTPTQDEISEELMLEFVNDAFRASGLTQKEVASALGITQPAVHLALRGVAGQRATMVRIFNTWHPTLQVEQEPIIRYRIKRREAK
ncbi:MAG: hypothetical protein JNJ94_12715 [Chlorobi bacterium]|nr:hypothetical protein [Chlorobiota bacterium]